MTGESEVIYFRRHWGRRRGGGGGRRRVQYEWRSKRYYPSGRAMLPVAPGPVVEYAAAATLRRGGGSGSGEPEGDTDDMEDTAATTSATTTAGKRKKDAGVEKGTPSPTKTTTTTTTNTTVYYQYNDFVPLEQAVEQQMKRDPPPVRLYFHPTNLRPITMGEWMLSDDPRYRPAQVDGSWRQRGVHAVRTLHVCLLEEEDGGALPTSQPQNATVATSSFGFC